MKLITYAEAAGILSVSVQTLKQALEPDRQALTKAGRRGTSGLLIEEQVRLFLGNNPRTGKKKRLSRDALTPGENAAWQRYADEFVRANMTIVPDDIDARIARQVEQRLAKVEKKNVQREAINLFSRFLATLTEDEEQGVPQGSFFSENPIIGMMVLLLSGVAMASMGEMYANMDEEEQEEIRDWLEEFDEALRLIEQSQGRKSNITKLKQIQKQRERIAEFRQEIATIAI